MALTSAQIKFLTEFYKKASQICPIYGLKAIGAITAQAMCESNWNKSKLSNRYYNFFGMKCGSSWKGASVNMTTKEEYTKGTLTTIKDNFRVFNSLEDGIKGYCEFIRGLSRYSNLIGLTDDETYIRTIKADGWATSSTYVKTLTGILKNHVQPRCMSDAADSIIISPDENKTADYYPTYDGFSISLVVALRTVGADFSLANRKEIAKANGITGYKGTAAQNTKLLELLKKGMLRKESF